ncbi:MAG: AbrB/MazE/SpoVT family DNA-binding domain-containing protein [Nanoarchaeota archaeon]
MKRKLIGQKDSYTLTLPKKWVKEQNLKSGDEIDIGEESNGSLSIKTSAIKPKAINIYSFDSTGMTKFELEKLFRGLYRSRVEEIIVNFSNPKVWDHQNNKPTTIQKICEKMCTRLIGLEIIKQESNSLTLQCFISKDDERNMGVIKRRIFLLIKDFMDSIIENLDDFKEFQKTTYNTHDNIAKFIEYYLRILIYSKIPSEIKSADYSLIMLLDKIVDKLRHLSDEITNKPSKKTKDYLEKLFDLFNSYYKFIYGIDNLDSKEMLNKRYMLWQKIKNEKFKIDEYKILCEVLLILHTASDVFEFKRILDLQKNIKKTN